ncbi:MAG: peptide-methionine (S)-S-oxide reductase MsrA [Bacteroidota bacterium]
MLQRTFLLFFTSLSIILTSCGQQQSSALKSNSNLPEVPAIADYIEGKGLEQYSVATFAGGCFWCTEASFERIKGVKEVISGYSGGKIKNPSYRQVASGSTKHAEAIQIYFDAEVVSFEKLLEVFYVAHDGTQVNRQGPDRGPQYRSEIFYHNEVQKEASENYIKKLNASGKFSRPIATLVNPYKEFWVAEAYHQDYYPSHQDNPYIANVSKPKVEKVEKVFKDILKPEYL